MCFPVGLKPIGGRGGVTPTVTRCRCRLKKRGDGPLFRRLFGPGPARGFYSAPGHHRTRAHCAGGGGVASLPPPLCPLCCGPNESILLSLRGHRSGPHARPPGRRRSGLRRPPPPCRSASLSDSATMPPDPPAGAATRRSVGNRFVQWSAARGVKAAESITRIGWGGGRDTCWVGGGMRELVEPSRPRTQSPTALPIQGSLSPFRRGDAKSDARIGSLRGHAIGSHRPQDPRVPSSAPRATRPRKGSNGSAGTEWNGGGSNPSPVFPPQRFSPSHDV